MKRRILALVLALVLAYSLSTVTFAANENEKEVTVQVIQKNVYDTKIDWNGFDFVYDFTSQEPGWNHTKATVTVTNNSTNAKINVSCTMAPNESLDEAVAKNLREIDFEFDATPAQLNPNGGRVTYTFTISGTPENQSVSQTTIGTVAISIT